MPTSETAIERQAPPAPRQANALTGFINYFATPLTTGLFVVSAVSGVALFFHWTPGVFHAMHEWLSMALLGPVVLHVWKNWRSLLGYAKRGTLGVALVASLVVALPFVYSGLAGGNRGNAAVRIISIITQAPLSDLAPVLKTTPDKLLATLQQRGYQVQSTDDTLNAIATASGKQPSEVLFAVTSAR